MADNGSTESSSLSLVRDTFLILYTLYSHIDAIFIAGFSFQIQKVWEMLCGSLGFLFLLSGHGKCLGE